MSTKEKARTAGYSFHHHPSSSINGLGTSVTMTWTNGEAVAKRCNLSCHSANCGNRQSMVDRSRRRASITISMERYTSVWDEREGGPASFGGARWGRGVMDGHAGRTQKCTYKGGYGYTRSRGIANRGERTRAMTLLYCWSWEGNRAPSTPRHHLDDHASHHHLEKQSSGEFSSSFPQLFH